MQCRFDGNFRPAAIPMAIILLALKVAKEIGRSPHRCCAGCTQELAIYWQGGFVKRASDSGVLNKLPLLINDSLQVSSSAPWTQVTRPRRQVNPPFLPSCPQYRPFAVAVVSTSSAQIESRLSRGGQPMISVVVCLRIMPGPVSVPRMVGRSDNGRLST